MNRLFLALSLLLSVAPASGQTFLVNSFIIGTADPAPTLTTATLGPTSNELTLSFSENVYVGYGGSGGFTVSLSGGAATLAYSSGSGSNDLVYTVSRPVVYSETGTLSFTPPGDGIEDVIGNDLASISGFTLTNSVPSEPSFTTTSIPHDELLEGFQVPSTGYENTWTEIGTTANITKPYDSTALTTNRPSDGNLRVLDIDLPTTGTETYVRWTRGSDITAATNTDLVFYVYVSGVSATFDARIVTISNGGGTAHTHVKLVNSSGVLSLTAVSTTSSSAVTISANTWTKVHIHLNATAANCYFEAGNGGAYVTTNTFTRGAFNYGRFDFGGTVQLDSLETARLRFDLISLNTP